MAAGPEALRVVEALREHLLQQKAGSVAVNHENDTCFENGVVMGYADCKY